MARSTLLTVLALGLPALAGAQEAFHDGRIRHVEPGVSIQRASETAAEEAVPNLPFLPGDRVWTDRSGRVEFQFAVPLYLSPFKAASMAMQHGQHGPPKAATPNV